MNSLLEAGAAPDHLEQPEPAAGEEDEEKLLQQRLNKQRSLLEDVFWPPKKPRDMLFNLPQKEYMPKRNLNIKNILF